MQFGLCLCFSGTSKHSMLLNTKSDGRALLTQVKELDISSEWLIHDSHVSRDVWFPTVWYVIPARAQTGLRIRAVWSEPLMVA